MLCGGGACKAPAFYGDRASGKNFIASRKYKFLSRNTVIALQKQTFLPNASEFQRVYTVQRCIIPVVLHRNPKKQGFCSCKTEFKSIWLAPLSRINAFGSNGGGGLRGGFGGNDGGGGGEDPPNWGKLLAIVVFGGLFVVCSSRALAQVVNQDIRDSKEAGDGTPHISENALWVVKEGKWIRYVMDEHTKELVKDVTKMNGEEAMVYERKCMRGEVGKHEEHKFGVRDVGRWCVDMLKTTMLPVGYPKTVSDDYTEYTLWRMGQIIASQISGVLTTQALLYAVGLGKGAIPTAAAVNWVLKDGIGYLSKILLSKYGRHFDVHPKRWRLISDLMENYANALELLTPTFPHAFVPLTAIAGAGKSAAGLIQAATRSCFYAGFATQHNFAEVIAKGEAQGMLSKSLGIAMGIVVSSRVGSSGPLLIVTFTLVSAVHILCNLKSYQAVQLHTLNPYRTGLIMAEYLTREHIPSVKDVNSQEPILPLLDFFFKKQTQNTVSESSKQVASEMEKKLRLGVSFGEVVADKEYAETLFEIYRGEEYILAYQADRFKVLLKESSTPRDMLRAVVQATYIQYALHNEHTSTRELLRSSHENMHNNFDNLMQQLQHSGWSTDGLVARPSSNRIQRYSRTPDSR